LLSVFCAFSCAASASKLLSGLVHAHEDRDRPGGLVARWASDWSGSAQEVLLLGRQEPVRISRTIDSRQQVIPQEHGAGHESAVPQAEAAGAQRAWLLDRLKAHHHAPLSVGALGLQAMRVCSRPQQSAAVSSPAQVVALPP
jgi:hypothetical protein